MRKINFFLILCAMIGFSCSNNETKDVAVTGNPLIDKQDNPFGVASFEKIKPEHYLPAFEEGMKRQNDEINSIINNSEIPDFKNTVEALFNSDELLYNVSLVFDNATSANTSSALDSISEVISPRLARHRDEISMNPKLFEKIKAVYENKASFSLNAEQTFLMDNIYKSFVRNGALLAPEKQAELKKINEELSGLSVKFGQNLLAETNAFKMFVDKKEDLAGLPEDVISGAAEAAEKDGKTGQWMFTTHKPSMLPFLQYAKNRSLREKILTAYMMRGNNGNSNDNNKVLAKMVTLRYQKAALLGYKNYAAYKLETRMAKSPENAFELLNKLWEKSIAVAKKDAVSLQKLLSQDSQKNTLAAWDWSYYSEKLRKEKYNLEESEVRPYFKLEDVTTGIFMVAEKLYGLTFTKIDNISLPHPDAIAYEVKEADGKHLGVFYLDFFPRDSKRGGAWCTEYRGHHIKEGKEITPITSVVCNFTKPTKDTPSLLSMDETETMFHEFGHALESLMSKVSYRTTFVATDFVELPSQVMEHWAFHKDVLKLYAKHYKTGEVIPDVLVQKINNSSLFNQGFGTTEYLGASLLDLEYHSIENSNDVDVQKFEKEFLIKIGLIPEIPPRYRSTYFSHITGGYDAGYYSYIWSAVLDNDAFDAFEEKGVFDKSVAEKFRKNILEKDGIEDPVNMYVNFRGKEAGIEPLLKNRGLL